MSRKAKLAILSFLVVDIVLLVLLLVGDNTVAVLDTKGVIAQRERGLMLIALSLMLVVVIPVFVLLFTIVHKYRVDNVKESTAYEPDWDHSRKLEFLWWALPCTIILILAAVTWRSSHDLDPYKAINANKPPMTIQVVALQWKWLFIYPQQDIATVNYVRLPENTPIDFEITSDASMNSFWIPQLGGQVYAMTGMATHLHLMATSIGSYNGSSANISGAGFAGMHFIAQSTSQTDFENWVQTVKQAPQSLTTAEYAKLAPPSQNNPQAYYAAEDKSLYNQIIAKYTGPMQGDQNMGMH